MTTIVLASSNPHKLEEIQAIWAHLSSDHQTLSRPELTSLSELGLEIAEPVEDQSTFEANAVLKARYYAQATGLLCIADDSGLEVDALNGQPGVYSARYAQMVATEPKNPLGAVGGSTSRQEIDAANNRLLLENLRDVPADKRTARFVCTMALCAPVVEGERGLGRPVATSLGRPQTGQSAVDAPQTLAVVRGTIEGRIIGPGQSPRGDNGFGYDPLFVVPDLDKTTAELPPAQKNAISHRSNAARKMWREITKLVGQGLEHFV